MAKVIKNRILAHQSYTAPTGAGSTGTFLKLSDVEERLDKLEKAQDPKDLTLKASSLYVDLPHQAYMNAQCMTPGSDNTTYLFTHHGAKLLANLVLPGHFFKGLRQLSAMDEHGAKIATNAFQKFAGVRDERVMVRTINTRHPDNFHQVIRAIRSCHSTQYAPLSNLQLTKDLQSALTSGVTFPGDAPGAKGNVSYSTMPVLEWVLSDERMRMRFCGVDPAHAAFAAVLSAGSPFLDGEPMPVFEIHNSEVGMRRVVIRAGVFLADKGVFIGAYGLGGETSWTHRGNVGRIRHQLKSAIEDILTEANAVCEAYREAGEIEIEDAYTFLQKQIEHQVPKSVAQTITETLASQVAVKALSPVQQLANVAQPGSALQAALASLKTATLAEICDAVATVAKSSTDLSKQYDLERLAATILHKGRKIAGAK